MSSTQEDTPSQPTTAAEWFARLQGPFSAEDSRAFEHWLAEDPAREDAYRRLETRWAEIGLAATDKRLLNLKAQALARRSRRPAALRGRALYAIVLTIGLTAAGSGWWWLQNAPLTYQTGRGERLNVTLQDRSQVDLAPNSRLRVRLGRHERRLDLEGGQAYFIVAHETRPFRVYAADRVVTATGTQFQVQIDGRQAEVLLVEGAVTVAPTRAASGPRQVLKPSQSLAGPLEGAKPVQGDVQVETAWRVGRLVFRERPLSEVVDEFNRWSTARIEIGDPSVADTPVSGSFRYDGAGDFVTALQTGLGLHVETTADGRSVISRGSPNPSM